MAKKVNRFEEEIDLTSYSWVNAGGDDAIGKPGCGGCHPGGGGLEYDREGRRYDERLTEEPGLAQTLDGDYHGSRWDRSGVVEADCFICHLSGYFYKARLEQLGRENFRWAVVAGSGMGNVTGSVSEGEVPSVAYNRRFFNEDGKVVIPLNSSPSSKNCLYCHGLADLIKRGFSWNDRENHDVHNANGVGCTSCHPGDGEHNFSKGDENLSTVRDDLDNTMRTCRDCHTLGYMGAPTPTHYSIRPNHLEKLACEVCHIPSLGRSAAAGLDVSTGKVVNYPTNGAEKIGQDIRWKPAVHRADEGHLQPVNPFAANLYTNRDANGTFYPLFLKELALAYEMVGGDLKKGPQGGVLVDTPEEIERYLTALASTLASNPRFEHVDPCYHMGDELYSLDEMGSLVVDIDTSWVSAPDAFNISHNVAPTQMALGAGGCADCHVDRAHMFTSWLHGEKPSGFNQPSSNIWGSLFGSGSWVYYLTLLHEHNALKVYAGPCFILIVFALVLYRFIRSSERKDEGEILSRDYVSSPLRQWLRLVQLSCFSMIVLTGYIFFFNKVDIQALFFSSPHVAIKFHWGCGLLFVSAMMWDIMNHMRSGVPLAMVLRVSGRHRNEAEDTKEGLLPKTDVVRIPWEGLMMLATGGFLIIRETLSPNLTYILSMLHSFFAFLIVAVFVARGYWRWGQKHSMLKQVEEHISQGTFIKK